MRFHDVPNIILLLGLDDANDLVSGVLDLKGCKSSKCKTAQDCLYLLNQYEGKVDLILVKKELAESGNFMLVDNIRKINPDVMILIIADEVNEGERLIERGIDEFIVTPISAENTADKILMMLAKRELKKIKEKAAEA